MQRGTAAELERMLRAIGAPAVVAARPQQAQPPPPPAAAAGAAASAPIVKAGSDDLRAYLANWAEHDAYLRRWPCLHGMLAARGPVAFELHACQHEIGRLSSDSGSDAVDDAAARADMERERQSRGQRLVLSADECAGAAG